MTSSVTKRDLGIDLLRVLAMGLIVLHHLLVHGGLTTVFPAFSASGMLMHLVNALTRCAVNVYALISGYVMVRSRFRPSRLIGLWLQVVFYGVLAALCLPLMGGDIHPGEFFSAVTPISHDAYWYFTCYVVVFCLSPFLNGLLNHLTKRQTELLLTALAALFCVLPTLMLTDRFQLSDGYHPAWLIILYLFGGSMRLHGLRFFTKRWQLLAAAAGCVFLGWGFRLAVLASRAHVQEELLLHYTAPTMLVCGVALLLLFAGRRLPAWLGKAATFLSPLTFGVYLIHDNRLIREHLIHMKLTALAELNPAWMLAGLLACWAGVYAVCLLMEWLRTKLFALLRVSDLCAHAERRLFQLGDRLFPKADA